MNELQIFSSEEFGNIRTVTIDNEPWFVGKDVADALGYQNGSRDINTHVSEEDRKILTTQNYQNSTFEIPNRGLTIINESGLYALIFGSKLESARRFKNWVTREVLPEIRSTGGGEIQTPGIKYGISGRNHQGRGIYRIMNLDTAEKALQCNTDATQCNDVATACNEEIE